MTNLTDNIRSAVRRVGTQEAFAHLMGMKNRHSIKTWIRAGTVPAKHIVKFCVLTGAKPEEINRDLAAIALINKARKTD